MNAGKDKANTVELLWVPSMSSPLATYVGTHELDDTKGPYDTSKPLLSSPGNETHVTNKNTTTADTPLNADKTTMEARSKSSGGKLEEENNKCRALNKLGNHGKDCTDQNGSTNQKKV